MLCKALWTLNNAERGQLANDFMVVGTTCFHIVKMVALFGTHVIGHELDILSAFCALLWIL